MNGVAGTMLTALGSVAATLIPARVSVPIAFLSERAERMLERNLNTSWRGGSHGLDS